MGFGSAVGYVTSTNINELKLGIYISPRFLYAHKKGANGALS
jgi:hypothetical protein